MTSRTRPLFPIGRKMGLVFAVLTVVLVGLAVVGITELAAIRADAGQLLEEVREAGLTAQLRTEIEMLELQLARAETSGGMDQGVREILRAQIAEVEADLLDLASGPGEGVDPSREEHQEAEARLLSTIRAEVEAVRVALERGGAAGSLDRAPEYASILASETREEAERANEDLVQRAGRARAVLVAAMVVIITSLLGASALIRKAVVLPIRRLTARVEELGRGPMAEPGVGLRSRDEIGVLSRAFEDMAGRVASTQESLQERVEARTRELIRAARYADIGVLASGVAHEINNPLASIASCAEGLQRRLSAGPVSVEEQKDYLGTIASEAYRARDITARLLALARADRGIVGPVALEPLLEQVDAITRHSLLERGVRLDVSFEAPGLGCCGVAEELLQALVNLIRNAMDASPDGGLVRVAVGRRQDVVEIAVEDQGPGVPEEDRERIFVPFFTTKPPGRGTGLGLALVAAIVEAHEGSIRIESSDVGGARFVVSIPEADRGAEGSA
jgi:signal transduction histidine kinase